VPEGCDTGSECRGHVKLVGDVRRSDDGAVTKELGEASQSVDICVDEDDLPTFLELATDAVCCSLGDLVAEITQSQHLSIFNRQVCIYWVWFKGDRHRSQPAPSGAR